MPPVAILDIDGTLVDSNFQHAVAWYRAFHQHGVVIPLWRIHRSIGMGGDQLVPTVAGDEVEEQLGDEIRPAHDAIYFTMIAEVEPLPGARELIVELKDRGHTVVLASSAKATEVDHYIDLLDARELVDGWTSSADVEATKPAPDVVGVALEKVGGGEAVLVGDSVYDCESATRAGVEALGVVTGGFGESELREAGAVAVFDSLEDLQRELDGTPLGAGS
ncbi:MAG: HAD family hydrolase [Thermoleophilaceae bacterium]|nr:HAD family hydrolase [Thermoleophilaceae bacterium]